MDASCFCCQFSLNTAGIIIGVYEIVQYTLLFFFALHFFKGKWRDRQCTAASMSMNWFNLNQTRLVLLSQSTDDSDFLTIVTCCLCSLIITSALLVYGSFKVTIDDWQLLRSITLRSEGKQCHECEINCLLLQNIRRYVVSWIVVVVMIVVIQLMVLFDVIHVVNTKSPEASDKSFLYTALEVFCLGESDAKMTQTRSNRSKFTFRIEKLSSGFEFHVFWIFDDEIELPFVLYLGFCDRWRQRWVRERERCVSCKLKGISMTQLSNSITETACRCAEITSRSPRKYYPPCRRAFHDEWINIHKQFANFLAFHLSLEINI